MFQFVTILKRGVSIVDAWGCKNRSFIMQRNCFALILLVSACIPGHVHAMAAGARRAAGQAAKAAGEMGAKYLAEDAGILKQEAEVLQREANILRQEGNVARQQGVKAAEGAAVEGGAAARAGAAGREGGMLGGLGRSGIAAEAGQGQRGLMRGMVGQTREFSTSGPAGGGLKDIYKWHKEDKQANVDGEISPISPYVRIKDIEYCINKLMDIRGFLKSDEKLLAMPKADQIREIEDMVIRYANRTVASFRYVKPITPHSLNIEQKLERDHPLFKSVENFKKIFEEKGLEPALNELEKDLKSYGAILQKIKTRRELMTFEGVMAKANEALRFVNTSEKGEADGGPERALRKRLEEIIELQKKNPSDLLLKHEAAVLNHGLELYRFALRVKSGEGMTVSDVYSVIVNTDGLESSINSYNFWK